MTLNQHDMQWIIKRYNKLSFYKAIHNYNKAIVLCLEILNELLEIDLLNHNQGCQYDNCILESGLQKITFIVDEKIIIFYLLELFDLYIKNGNRKQVNHLGVELVGFLGKYGFGKLPKHFQRRIKKVYLKCKDDAVVESFMRGLFDVE